MEINLNESKKMIDNEFANSTSNESKPEFEEESPLAAFTQLAETVPPQLHHEVLMPILEDELFAIMDKIEVLSDKGLNQMIAGVKYSSDQADKPLLGFAVFTIAPDAVDPMRRLEFETQFTEAMDSLIDLHKSYEFED